jgi:hypothetical protein
VDQQRDASRIRRAGEALSVDAGRVWASPALPDAVHDLAAARMHGPIDVMTAAAVMTFADKGPVGGCRATEPSPVR